MSNEIRRDPQTTARISVVSGIYERLGKGDVPGVLRLLGPHVRWTEAEGFSYYAGTAVGPQAVLDNVLKRMAADWSDFAATPKDHLVEGARIASFGTYTGIYERTGKPMHADFAYGARPLHGLAKPSRTSASSHPAGCF